MFFLTFSNAKLSFIEREFIWRFYIATKALPITKQVELINKNKFAKAALYEDFKIFVVHIAALEALLASMIIYPSQTTQIAILY